MGLDISSLVSTAFGIVENVVDGAVSEGTYKTVTSSYNATTGAATETPTSATVRLIRKKLDLSAQIPIEDGNLSPIERAKSLRVYLIAAEDLGAVVPSVNDKITIGAETWKVIAVGGDPTSGLFTVTVRRP